MTSAVAGKAQSFNEIWKSGDFAVEAEIIKADNDKRIVYGWASVVEKDGVPVVDHQGDVILVDDLIAAAHDFMTVRKGGVLHDGRHVADMIESIVLTKDVQESLGIDLGQVGWFIGMKVNDDEVWQGVMDDDLTAFSIGGVGQREQVDKHLAGRHEQKRHGRGGGGGLPAPDRAAMQDYMYGFYDRLHLAKEKAYVKARCTQLLDGKARPDGMSQKYGVSRGRARALEWVIAKVWLSGKAKYGI